VPFPLFGEPALIATQPALLAACHGHPADVATAMLPVPPLLSKVAFDGVSV
jgi:hypothetical protein